MECHPWVNWYVEKIGFVPYKLFCKNRWYLKRQCKIANNIPLHYVTKQTGYKLEDIATISPLRRG